MQTVHVKASKEYDVLIGTNLLQTTADHIAAMKNVQRVCIVSDTNVFPLYGQALTNDLSVHGFEVTAFTFPAGETSKQAGTYLELLNHLAEHAITRSDLIIALGGGVVGDMAGFAAATYLRGIRYIQIPTTLLAMVDSSVGGKTAIDLPAGKNLAGAFYQPNLVLCDLNCLNTLPENIFCDGCAEVIKYGILYDESLFSHLLENGIDFDREMVITRCVELKRDVVSADEFDTGERMKLNLGHTVGHAIEKRSNFEVSHGTAVAMGMAIVARCGHHAGICSQRAMEQILDILNRFGLPNSVAFTAKDLAQAAHADKKRSADTLSVIIPEEIGRCRIEQLPVSDFEVFLEAGL